MKEYCGALAPLAAIKDQLILPHFLVVGDGEPVVRHGTLRPVAFAR